MVRFFRFSVAMVEEAAELHQQRAVAVERELDAPGRIVNMRPCDLCMR
jgi:hypothetical protein